MATSRGMDGSPVPCLCLVAGRRCGEAARRLLRDSQLVAVQRRPVKQYCTRQGLPVFTAEAGAGELKRVRDQLLAVCGGLVEVVEGLCIAREQRRPPVSYVIVGRVAIVSLDERLAGREREVAEELLRMVPGIVAVYGKEATVGEYRAQKLVHLAGEQLQETIHVEHGLRIPVPLGRVYINPRLATEHRRVAETISEDDVVLDMFSGVGGFSLVASALGRGRLIVANDANPWAVASLLRAMEMNRSRLKTPIVAVCSDARRLPELLSPVFTRIIMNLPHSAVNFIPVARRLCSPRGCVLHVYTVASSPEEALARVPGGSSVTHVLDYAPHRFIYRVDVVVRGEDQVEG